MANNKPTRKYFPRQHKPQWKTSCVYVVTCREFDGLYKVGKAYDLDLRLRSLQIALPYLLVVEYVIPAINPIKVEAKLHKFLRDYQVRGEWYKIGSKMLATIKMRCWTDSWF